MRWKLFLAGLTAFAGMTGACHSADIQADISSSRPIAKTSDPTFPGLPDGWYGEGGKDRRIEAYFRSTKLPGNAGYQWAYIQGAEAVTLDVKFFKLRDDFWIAQSSKGGRDSSIMFVKTRASGDVWQRWVPQCRGLHSSPSWRKRLEEAKVIRRKLSDPNNPNSDYRYCDLEGNPESARLLAESLDDADEGREFVRTYFGAVASQQDVIRNNPSFFNVSPAASSNDGFLCFANQGSGDEVKRYMRQKYCK